MFSVYAVPPLAEKQIICCWVVAWLRAASGRCVAQCRGGVADDGVSFLKQTSLVADGCQRQGLCEC